MNQLNSQAKLDVVVCQTIEEVTGNLYKDIRLDSDLEEDLGMAKVELVKIISAVQNKLELVLSDHAKREILEDAHNVQDLITIIEEEYEY